MVHRPTIPLANSNRGKKQGKVTDQKKGQLFLDDLALKLCA